jgi:hypothetical protein
MAATIPANTTIEKRRRMRIGGLPDGAWAEKGTQCEEGKFPLTGISLGEAASGIAPSLLSLWQQQIEGTGNDGDPHRQAAQQFTISFGVDHR